MITTKAFNRAYGWPGDPNCVLYRSDNVVIGPANQAYTWVAFDKERSTAMVLRVSSQMPQRGSRKCGTLGSWFSEPPNREFGGKKLPYGDQLHMQYIVSPWVHFFNKPITNGHRRLNQVKCLANAYSLVETMYNLIPPVNQEV